MTPEQKKSLRWFSFEEDNDETWGKEVIFFWQNMFGIGSRKTSEEREL